MAEHGTRSCYVQGCRRPECRAANAAYRADARKRAAEGDTTDRRTCRPDIVDAAPARAHLLKLKEDKFPMSDVAKALEGELSYHTILKVRRGQIDRIAENTEALILAVGVESEA